MELWIITGRRLAVFAVELLLELLELENAAVEDDSASLAVEPKLDCLTGDEAAALDGGTGCCAFGVFPVRLFNAGFALLVVVDGPVHNFGPGALTVCPMFPKLRLVASAIGWLRSGFALLNGAGGGTFFRWSGTVANFSLSRKERKRGSWVLKYKAKTAKIFAAQF